MQYEHAKRPLSTIHIASDLTLREEDKCKTTSSHLLITLTESIPNKENTSN